MIDDSDLLDRPGRIDDSDLLDRPGRIDDSDLLDRPGRIDDASMLLCWFCFNKGSIEVPCSLKISVLYLCLD